MTPSIPLRSPSRLALLPLSLLASAAISMAALPTTDPAKAVARAGPIERGDDSDAEPLLDIAAPELPELRWLDGHARTLASLDGRIVVVRSFTNECPFCASTIPTLERLHRRFGDRGVTVLGVYHPKPPAPTSSDDVATFVKSLGVTFPVAVDEDWSLVRRWWKAYSGGPWTSITWVLDGNGKIRYVHPGGEYHDEGGGPAHERCRNDFRRLEDSIEALLAGSQSAGAE